jgi:hypothetical protein
MRSSDEPVKMAASQNEFIGILVYCTVIKFLMGCNLPNIHVYMCRIHRMFLDFSHRSVFQKKHDVSETGSLSVLR